ncbi:hypothetical protein CWI38_0062p0010 [Hamiltosporidium tvaerminnensis]|uniref:Uncharacterized protein n=1 Tax=Hamiltosporidium tvaerminnensis TaxID=1176355 RepID=A0A4Q9M1B5_9MICR|nr:hypothetical protein CWI38_0062p0010 [Hamiltosporidium tvaerminnensis]
MIDVLKNKFLRMHLLSICTWVCIYYYNDTIPDTNLQKKIKKGAYFIGILIDHKLYTNKISDQLINNAENI